MIHPRGYSGREMFFVIMDNAFCCEVPNCGGLRLDLQERYDLKGSTVGRYASAAEKEAGDSVILKDLDVKRRIKVGPVVKKRMMEQLERDTKLLADHMVMDYSFLVGVHKRSASPIPRLESADDPPSPAKKQQSVFKMDDGGLASEDGSELYFFSIIDIFQEWNAKKENGTFAEVVGSRIIGNFSCSSRLVPRALSSFFKCHN